MQLVTDRLRLFIDNHPTQDTNYNIACYILENFNTIQTMSITQLANACFVSQPTLSRFCRALGYDDFHHFRKEAIITASSHEEYFDEEKNKLKLDTDVYQGIKHYIDDINNHLLETLNCLDIAQIDSFLTRIYNTKKVIVFGELYSGLMASYLQIGLLYIGKHIITCSNMFEMSKLIKDISKDDMIVILSVDGNTMRRNTKLIEDIIDSPCYKAIISQNEQIINAYKFDEFIRITNQQIGTGKYPLTLLVEIMTKRYAQLFKNTK